MYTPTRTYMKAHNKGKKEAISVFYLIAGSACLVLILLLTLFTHVHKLGGGVMMSSFTEVPKETAVYLVPTYEYTFINDKTGEEIIQQVTQEEYETWLHGSMTVPNYPKPALKGATFVKAVGGKENKIVSEPILTDKEYIVLQEQSATNTAVYKTAQGVTTIKPI